jgi:hypothetical protein
MATLGSGVIQSRTGPDYGAWRYGRPFGAAVHCLQCPGNVNVQSLTGPGSYADNEGVSPHIMAGQNKIVELLGPDRQGAHVGPQGNPILWGAEVTGMAEWDNAQWWDNAPAVLNQAKGVGLMWRFHGFSVNDLKWGSLGELQEAKRRHNAGLPPVAPRCWIHWDVTKALGGTTHWDVGLGYLFEEFIVWARQWASGERTNANPGRPDTSGTPGGGSGAGGDVFDILSWISEPAYT